MTDPNEELKILKLEPRIRRWMANNTSDYEGPTELVEAAAIEFLVDYWLDDSIHPIWDWALSYIEVD